MKIKQTKLTDLTLDPDNARIHDKRNLDAIKASLEAFGQRKPIVVADGVVVAGNGTLEAAQALGWDEIATVSADDLTPEQRTAFAIADNRTAELAAWDDTKLAAALRGIPAEGGGFEATELADFTRLIEEAGGVFRVQVGELPDELAVASKDYCNVVFSIHVDHKALVDEAITRARGLPGIEFAEELNMNKNGNALVAMCVALLEG